MKTQKLKGGLALGCLTAAVALFAGISTASAATAPGAGSFPRSFLIPGTNTSLSIYGAVIMKVSSEIGSPYSSDTGPAGDGATGWGVGGLPLNGPGASAVDRAERAIHGGLRWSAKYSNVFFETRTPTDLGEIKTVVMFNFGKLTNQGTYQGHTTTTNEPQVGAGNNEVPRLEWAYGTLGPWLIGQTNSAWADPLMRNPIGDPANQIGPMQTANIRRPQIRYTYLAGNGVTLSASLEANTYANLVYGNSAIHGPFNENMTDVGGITSFPSFNTGIAWTQPWGHVMGRVGVAEDQIRNAVTAPGTHSAYYSAFSPGATGNNLKKFGWAVEGGAMLNTWGHDQWRGLVVYSDGAPTYLTDLHSAAFVNATNGSIKPLKELAFNTSYIHHFSRNWSVAGDFGIGFFNNPSNDPVANYAHVEKRHLNSALDVKYSPIPGKAIISLEWDHYNRWVQEHDTSGQGNAYSVTFIFLW